MFNRKLNMTKPATKITFALLASAVMLTVIQSPAGLAFAAWVALVPFILACNSDVKSSSLFLAAYIVSLFYWLGNLYWLEPVTTAGWIALCFYMALLWPADGSMHSVLHSKKDTAVSGGAFTGRRRRTAAGSSRGWIFLAIPRPQPIRKYHTYPDFRHLWRSRCFVSYRDGQWPVGGLDFSVTGVRNNVPTV